MRRAQHGFVGVLKAVGLAWLLGLWLPVLAADVAAFTEEWAPYNFTDQGEVRGISTDILRAMCEKSKLICDVQMVPWARAYRTAIETPNTLVFTTARKPSRENEFLWIGPILPRTTWVYVRSDLKSRIKDLNDLAHYRIGVVRDEAAQQDLLAAGIPAEALSVQATNDDVLRMLSSGMVDAMVETEVGMAWSLRAASLAASSVSRSTKLSDDGAYYFALNPKSEPAIARALQKALDTLRHEKKIDAIVRRYTFMRK